MWRFGCKSGIPGQDIASNFLISQVSGAPTLGPVSPLGLAPLAVSWAIALCDALIPCITPRSTMQNDVSCAVGTHTHITMLGPALGAGVRFAIRFSSIFV